MKESIVKQVAREAKRDSLMLYWSMQYLSEKLKRMPQEVERAQRRDTREGDADTHTLRVESEALALVLAAVLKAYPAGKDNKKGGRSYGATRLAVIPANSPYENAVARHPPSTYLLLCVFSQGPTWHLSALCYTLLALSPHICLYGIHNALTTAIGTVQGKAGGLQCLGIALTLTREELCLPISNNVVETLQALAVVGEFLVTRNGRLYVAWIVVLQHTKPSSWYSPAMLRVRSCPALEREEYNTTWTAATLSGCAKEAYPPIEAGLRCLNPEIQSGGQVNPFGLEALHDLQLGAAR